jgi:TonB family protein
MMKNIISSPYRRMKILFILPVFALVLYAFAKPEYRYIPVDQNITDKTVYPGLQTKDVKGTIKEQGGKPLQGAAVVIKGTTSGTTTDSKGSFKLRDVPEDGSLVVSYVGFKTKVVKPVFTSEVTIQMIRDTVTLGVVGAPPPPPPPPPANYPKENNADTTLPPPPPPGVGIKVGMDGISPPPMIIVNGVISDLKVEQIDPNTIESINVLKDESAKALYGEKGKNGVLEITTKKSGSQAKSDLEEVSVVGNSNKQPMVIIEEMPMFPGGDAAMQAWISENLKYPGDAIKANKTGEVILTFVVSSSGKVENVKVKKSVFPSIDTEAIRVISNMPDWKPGSQNGKPVDIDYILSVNFDCNQKVPLNTK